MIRWTRAAAAVALALAAPSAALAFETVDSLPFPSTGAFPAWVADPVGPWTIFAYGGLMYDSNAFRAPVNEQGDMVARLGAGGRLIQRVVGRQAILLEGYGEYYDFQDLNEIDHFGYGARGEWLYEIGNNINGAAGYSRVRRHGDLGEFRIERRVMVTTERAFVDGGYRFHPDWRIFGGAEVTRSEDDLGVRPQRNTGSLRSSLTYRTPLGNTLGVEGRVTNGETPVDEIIAGAPSVTDDYEEREVSLVLSYALGAQLRVGGRVGQTEREYEQFPERNFDGTTYRGTIEWLPTQKIIFGFEAYHEPASIIDVASSHVIRTGQSAGVSWAPGFKLVFTARFVNERRENQGDISTVVLDTPPRDETLRVWRFGAGWEPARRWQLGLGLDVGERRSNELGRDYDYLQVMANVRWTY